MEFNSQICTTKEQSKRLLALGLKKETADMVILEHPRKEGRYFYIPKEDANWEGFPAWSLHRMIEMIPDKIAYPTIYDSAPLLISKDSMYYLHRFFDKYGDEDCSSVGDEEAIGSHNVYDYAVSVIGFLINEGYFNKEYLERI